MITVEKSTTPILVASHPRSGTHLLIDFLRLNFSATAGWKWWWESTDHLYLNIERTTARERNFDEKKTCHILKRARRPILKTHYTADWKSTWAAEETGRLRSDIQGVISKARHLYVVRDPVAVFQSYHRFLGGIYPSLLKQTLGSFATATHQDTGLTRLEWWRDHVIDWVRRDSTLAIQFKELIQHPASVAESIAQFCELDLPNHEPQLPRKIDTITQARLNRFLHMRPPSSAILASMQNPIQEAANYLTEDEKHRFATVKSDVERYVGSIR